MRLALIAASSSAGGSATKKKTLRLRQQGMSDIRWSHRAGGIQVHVPDVGYRQREAAQDCDGGSRVKPHNLPVLFDNIMFGLPSEYAIKVFLWASEMPWNDRYSYAAENFAREADRIRNVIGDMIDMSRRIYKDQSDIDMSDERAQDLKDFIVNRYANWKLGGNVRVPVGRTELDAMLLFDKD